MTAIRYCSVIVQFLNSGRESAKPAEPAAGTPSPTATPLEEITSEKVQTASPAPREQRIKERAFQIWVDEGRPEGRHQEHWRMAEAQIADWTLTRKPWDHT